MNIEEKKICPICKGQGCTCHVCKGLGFLKITPNSVIKKRRNAKSQKFATNSRTKYTAGDMKIIRDCENYSIKEAARLTKRSIKAIENMRWRLRKEAEADGQK